MEATMQQKGADAREQHSFAVIAGATRERRKCLELVFQKPGRAVEKANLIALNRGIFVLATRNIAHPVQPGDEGRLEENRLLWEFEWYGKYLWALSEIVPMFQTAIQDGSLTLRHPTTRATVNKAKLAEWLAMDIGQAINGASREFWYAPLPQGGYGPGFPDEKTMLPVSAGVDFDELAAWGEKSGIVAKEELFGLLGMSPESEGGTTAARRH